MTDVKLWPPEREPCLEEGYCMEDNHLSEPVWEESGASCFWCAKHPPPGYELREQEPADKLWPPLEQPCKTPLCEHRYRDQSGKPQCKKPMTWCAVGGGGAFRCAEHAPPGWELREPAPTFAVGDSVVVKRCEEHANYISDAQTIPPFTISELAFGGTQARGVNQHGVSLCCLVLAEPAPPEFTVGDRVRVVQCGKHDEKGMQGNVFILTEDLMNSEGGWSTWLCCLQIVEPEPVPKLWNEEEGKWSFACHHCGERASLMCQHSCRVGESKIGSPISHYRCPACPVYPEHGSLPEPEEDDREPEQEVEKLWPPEAEPDSAGMPVKCWGNAGVGQCVAGAWKVGRHWFCAQHPPDGYTLQPEPEQCEALAGESKESKPDTYPGESLPWRKRQCVRCPDDTASVGNRCCDACHKGRGESSSEKGMDGHYRRPAYRLPVTQQELDELGVTMELIGGGVAAFLKFNHSDSGDCCAWRKDTPYLRAWLDGLKVKELVDGGAVTLECTAAELHDDPFERIDVTAEANIEGNAVTLVVTATYRFRDGVPVDLEAVDDMPGVNVWDYMPQPKSGELPLAVKECTVSGPVTTIDLSKINCVSVTRTAIGVIVRPFTGPRPGESREEWIARARESLDLEQVVTSGAGSWRAATDEEMGKAKTHQESVEKIAAHIGSLATSSKQFEGDVREAWSLSNRFSKTYRDFVVRWFANAELTQPLSSSPQPQPEERDTMKHVNSHDGTVVDKDSMEALDRLIDREIKRAIPWRRTKEFGRQVKNVAIYGMGTVAVLGVLRAVSIHWNWFGV